MPISALISGFAIDFAKDQLKKIGKKELADAGKKVIHALKDSDKSVGSIISFRNQENYNNVVFFVHGFSGAADQTFGFTPTLLEKSEQFKGWNIFSIGYSSDVLPSIGKGIWSANPDIRKISWYLKTLLENIFGDYQRVAFVGHSMGGLVIQRLILDLSTEERKRISHVLLFGTPSAGLKKAFWARFWNSQIRDLSNSSAFIKKLREDWSSEFPSNPSFVFKVVAGSKDEFVPTKSSLLPFEERFHEIIEGNHISMVKSVSEEDTFNQSYQLILNILTNQSIQYLKGNREDINLILGEYHEVIQKFLPNAKDLAKPQLIQLVFALECNKQTKEALQVLEENPLAQNDSDLLGILGGRFKRKFLLEGLKKDLDLSIKHYLKGLQLAESKQDHKQIFYQAINLAFLYKVGMGDDLEMERYAKLALDHCISSTKDVWEEATIAEANLYLGNFDQALTYYKKAAGLAGSDVRAKISIYSNAYEGFRAMSGLKSREAEFVRELEGLFLG